MGRPTHGPLVSHGDAIPGYAGAARIVDHAELADLGAHHRTLAARRDGRSSAERRASGIYPVVGRHFLRGGVASDGARTTRARTGGARLFARAQVPGATFGDYARAGRAGVVERLRQRGESAAAARAGAAAGDRGAAGARRNASAHRTEPVGGERLAGGFGQRGRAAARAVGNAGARAAGRVRQSAARARSAFGRAYARVYHSALPVDRPAVRPRAGLARRRHFADARVEREWRSRGARAWTLPPEQGAGGCASRVVARPINRRRFVRAHIAQLAGPGFRR